MKRKEREKELWLSCAWSRKTGRWPDTGAECPRKIEHNRSMTVTDVCCFFERKKDRETHVLLLSTSHSIVILGLKCKISSSAAFVRIDQLTYSLSVSQLCLFIGLTSRFQLLFTFPVDCHSFDWFFFFLNFLNNIVSLSFYQPHLLLPSRRCRCLRNWL